MAESSLVGPVLLGFDARVDPLSGHSHLIHPNNGITGSRTTVRLSVDTMVWSSVFDQGEGLGLSQQDRDAWGLTGWPLPKWTGPNRGIWLNLQQLESEVNSHPATDGVDCWIIAVTVMKLASPVDPGPPPYRDETSPSQLPMSATFLGFDVADSYRLSGISNIGYSNEEAGILRPAYAPDLNQFGLFDDSDIAARFSEELNRIVQEHAPFWVYGMWCLREYTASERG